jgi:hypothetical protein
LNDRETRPRFAYGKSPMRFGPTGRACWLPVRGLAVSAALLIPGCKPEEKPIPFIPNTGQIQILNGCGKSGAAEQFRNYLTDRGFDIIEFGNAGSWNYAHTLVIARTGNEPVARDLAKVLDTDNLIHLSDPLALVDATVIIGKDYEELSKRWQKVKQ